MLLDLHRVRARPDMTAHDDQLLSPRDAYDRVARCFDGWRWSRFWQAYEAPLVTRWIDEMDAKVSGDLGCGTGHYLELLSRRTRLAIGVDLSVEMTRRSRATAPRASLVQASLDRLPLSAGCLEAVLCTRVLSHIGDLHGAMRELARVCAPGARLLLTDIHPEHPYTHTRIPLDGGTVRIRAYRHSLADIQEALTGSGFAVHAVEQYLRSSLQPEPSRQAFPKLFAGDVAVFYALMARRCESKTRVGAESRTAAGVTGSLMRI